LVVGPDLLDWGSGGAGRRSAANAAGRGQHLLVTAVTARGLLTMHSAARYLHPVRRPRTMRMLKIIVLGCVLAGIAITLKLRLDTPQGPQPLARAIVTTHLQKLQRELALP